ncbi:hypothetical protein [Nocardioides sp.]|uniref:hypothetical protein n=1 Tax=Nocardioides sp. TaxID=35761 RepID=UPI0035169EDE
MGQQDQQDQPGRQGRQGAEAPLRWIRVVLAGLGVCGLVVPALAVLLEDQLVAAWAGGAGLGADDTRVPPTFAPVAVVMSGVLLGHLLMLWLLVRAAQPWARHALALTGALVALGALALLLTGPPLVFVLAGMVVAGLGVGLAAACEHPDVAAWFRAHRVDDVDGTPIGAPPLG